MGVGNNGDMTEPLTLARSTQQANDIMYLTHSVFSEN